MQQRRGTAQQWTTANPILNPGEIGWESDNNKFKIGDGTNHWADLNYFVDADTLIDGAPGLLDTLNELAAAIGDDPSFFTTVATNLTNHQNDTTNVHGIADTAELATKAFAASLLTGASKSNITITGDKNGLTITAENGVADSTTDALTEGTSNKYFTDERAQDAVGNAVGTGLSYDDATGAISVDIVTIATQEYVDGAVSNAEVDQSTLAGSGISWNVATSQFDVDTTTIQARVADVSDTEIGYLNGVTSGIQSQLDDKLASATASSTYAPLASPTFTGTVTTDDLIVDGDFTVNGTNFSASATSITIEDNMVQLAHQNAANTVDLGLVVAYTDGTAKHAGIVRDVSDSTWKLFKDVADEPATTVNFGQGSLDNLAVNNLTAAGVVFTDGTQTKEGVPSRAPIIQKTAAYTLGALTERDSLIEVSHTGGSAVSVTIPADSTLNFPIGTSIDVLQTNTGSVAIAAGSGVTVNATPGLTLRTQWSSATLLKRAANTWVVYGDLK